MAVEAENWDQLLSKLVPTSFEKKVLSGNLSTQKRAEKKDCAKWHLMMLGKRANDCVELTVL